MTRALILVMNMFLVLLSTPIQREETGFASECGIEEMAEFYQLTILVVEEDLLIDAELKQRKFLRH